MIHPDPEVRQAIICLADALCTWERDTGQESVLIIRERNFVFRAMSGKPNVPNDVKDSALMGIIGMLPDEC